MRNLSGLDGLFLHLETEATPMHVASLHLFELPPGLQPQDFHARVQRHIQARLDRAPVLTRRLAEMPLQFANPVWIDTDALEMDYHVQRLSLPAPGSLQQLQDLAGRLHAERLDRERPLWRMAVIDGLASGQVACCIQVHHAVLDGQAAALLAQALFDSQPEATPAAPLASPPARGTAEQPSRSALVRSALSHDAGLGWQLLRHLPAVLQSLYQVLGGGSEAAGPYRDAKPAGKLGQNFAFGPRTLLNAPITAERGFVGYSVPLATLKALAKAHQATVNDIVLTLCSGTLRRYLKRHGGLPRKPLIAVMPISLRHAGSADYGVQATLSLVNLQTDKAAPLRRLLAIRDAAGAVRQLARRARGALPTDFPSLGLPWLLQALATLYGRSGLTRLMAPVANVVISNVAGPQQTLYLAGARMLSYWPMSICEHGLALNITVMSYDGLMGFGFTTARSAVPDAAEFEPDLQATLGELLTKIRDTPGPRRKAIRP